MKRNTKVVLKRDDSSYMHDQDYEVIQTVNTLVVVVGDWLNEKQVEDLMSNVEQVVIKK